MINFYFIYSSDGNLLGTMYLFIFKILSLKINNFMNFQQQYNLILFAILTNSVKIKYTLNIYFGQPIKLGNLAGETH